MKIKFIIFILLSFTSFNTIAEIPRESITEIRQLNEVEIIEKFSNYKASGTFDVIYEGVHYQITFEEKYYPNGEYTVLMHESGTMVSGNWKTENNKICYKAKDKDGMYLYGDIYEFECFYVFEGLESKYVNLDGDWTMTSYKNIYTSVTNGGDFQSRVDQLENLKDEPSSNSDITEIEEPKSLSDDALIDIAIDKGIEFDLDADGNLKNRDDLVNYAKGDITLKEILQSQMPELVECKKTYKSIPVRKEYSPVSYSIDVHEQPCDDSEVVKTLTNRAVVFVISKTETGNGYWYLIKEIAIATWSGDDVGEIIGYSKAKFFNTHDDDYLDDSNSKTYSDSPRNLLIDAYVNYVVIKKMHSMREGYAVVYINDSQMKKAKNQIIEIEKILVNEFSLDEDLLWDTAMRKYDQDYYVIDLMESTGMYTEPGNQVAMIALLSLDTIADEVIGSSSTKDF